MFDKLFLTNKIVKSLLKKEFEVFLTRGCFDIVAKKKILMLIKTLLNVDAFSEKHASSLRVISYFISAYPLVVSVKTNRDYLRDNIVYNRFQVPIVTPNMFEHIIEEETVPCVQSAKGRHAVSIDADVLRKKRKELDLTLAELSEHVGITKKALYEIENKRVNPMEENVKKLELFLKINLRLPFELRVAEKIYLKASDDFQKKVSKEFLRIGIDNSPVYSAPFEIIGKEKYLLITNLSKNTSKIKREASTIKKLSSILSSQNVFIVKKSREQEIEGIPILLESELPEIESSKELEKIMSERV